MAGKSGKVQRSSKEERAAALEVLREIWEKAYHDGEVKLEYNRQDGWEAEKAADVVHASLGDFRKKIRAKQTEHFDLYTQIMQCSLLKPDNFTVIVRRKEEEFSNRTAAILSVAHQFPELGLTSKIGRNLETGIEDILGDFRKKD